MDPTHIILPKGFVVNSQDIYKEVASYPTVPPEKIKEYWKVYTTTFRRLIDPTANRLENFWWHVWGSDRKYLSGAVLARLFEEISTGPTIAPIPGPPNRWEPPVFVDRPPPWELRRQAEKKASTDKASTVAGISKAQQGADATPPRPAKPDTEDTPAPAAGSSSSRPAQAPTPHPILKKSRGDSKSGPRPTARFIMPDDDDSKDDGEASSGSASTAGTDTRKSSSPAKSEKRKISAHTKRFHASIGTKRRPALPRRISSQSSTTSDTASREDVPGISKHQGGQHAVAPIAEQPGDQGSVTSTASTASPRQGLSAKAAGKRPAPKQPTEERAPAHQGLADPTPTSPSLENSRKQKQRETIPEQTQANLRHDASPVKLDRTQSTEFRRTTPRGRTTIPRSQSHIEPKGSSMASSKSLRRALAAEPTASTTTVAALGTIIDINRNEVPWPGTSTAESSEMASYGLPRAPSATSLLETRLMPTPPSATPEVPLGRTKSQLTLLLEREKGRLGDKSRSKH